MIQMCRDAGAKEIGVFPSLGNAYWRRSALSEKFRNEVKSIRSPEGKYREVSVPRCRALKKVEIAQGLLDCDVFINIPIAKDHTGTRFTGTMKNMMGVVWDREYWHRNDLPQCIADFASYRKPALTVVDAYNVLKQNGPRGVSVGDVVPMKSQIVSTDFVAADTAAAKLFGAEPGDIRHIQLAAQMNLGRIDLDALSINRIKL